jgi:hypothetical protein
MVENEGRNGQTLFRSSDDYKHFIRLLKRLVHGGSLHIICFALLRDSFHLVVREEERGSTAKAIQRLSIAYGIYFNTKYGKSGKVFHGPYKDRLLFADDEIMNAVCLIHAMPAQDYQDIETYQWSSYRRYVKRANTWVDTAFVERYFSTTDYVSDLQQMTLLFKRKLHVLPDQNSQPSGL